MGIALAASGGLVAVLSFSSLTGMSTIAVARDAATGGGEAVGAAAIAGAFIVSSLLAAFGVFLIAWSGLWTSWRLSRGEKSAGAARKAKTVVAERTPSRTQVREQYDRTRPKVDAAVTSGKATLTREVAPRASAGATQAKEIATVRAGQAKVLATGAWGKARERRERGKQTDQLGG